MGYGSAYAQRLLSPDPMTVAPPETLRIISGAQNLISFYRFIPGHWALAVPKLRLVRFHVCAWLCRANGTWSVADGRPKGLPYPSHERMASEYAVGAGPPPALPGASEVSLGGGTPGRPQ